MFMLPYITIIMSCIYLSYLSAYRFCCPVGVVEIWSLPLQKGDNDKAADVCVNVGFQKEEEMPVGLRHISALDLHHVGITTHKQMHVCTVHLHTALNSQSF